MTELSLFANDICFTPAEYAQLGQAVTDQAMQYGTIMLVIGVLIGYLAPKAAQYLKARGLIKHGGPAE